MTRNRSFLMFIVLLLVSLVAVPSFAARGKADFTRFYAIGDSYGAVIARQAHVTNFAIPTVSFPGIGPELQLVDVIKYPPTITPAPGQGQPINLNYPAPYNNLSIPGATVGDVTTLTGKESPTSTAKVFAQFILRGLGTEVDQALSQNPTFIAIWIGGNDALGAVLAGTPAVLTPADTFKTQYNAMLDRIVAGAPNAGVVVGNLPTHVLSAPIANTVPPFIVNPATRQPVLGPDGKPIFLFADLGGGKLGQLTAGSAVLLTAAGDLAQGFGIPPTLKTIPPFNALPHAGEPLPDKDVLTADEIATIEARLASFNDTINQSAAAHNVPVADISSLFDRVSSGKLFVGPMNITNAYLTGGFFSYDGFHATDMGYTLFANEYIRTINNAYGTNIPYAGIADLLSNNDPTLKTTSGAPLAQGMLWDMSEEAVEQIRAFIPERPAGRRRLTAGSH